MKPGRLHTRTNASLALTSTSQCWTSDGSRGGRLTTAGEVAPKAAAAGRVRRVEQQKESGKSSQPKRKSVTDDNLCFTGKGEGDRCHHGNRSK